MFCHIIKNSVNLFAIDFLISLLRKIIIMRGVTQRLNNNSFTNFENEYNTYQYSVGILRYFTSKIFNLNNILNIRFFAR